MPCLRLDGPRPGFLCGFHPIYKFSGWRFEIHSYCGPWPLNKDGEPRATPPGRKFWEMWQRFCVLTDAEKEKYREA